MRTTVAILLLLACPAAAGETFSGRVVRVTDGDTFVLSDQTRVRLWGIDAPEHRQGCDGADGRPYPCGVRAQQQLEALALGQEAVCEDRQRGGSFGRRVAACSVGGRDLGLEMVATGLAVDYRRYSKGAYAAAERQAQAAKRGVWGGHFELPGAWRRERRGE